MPAATTSALRHNGTTHVTLVAPKSVDPQRLVSALTRRGMSVTVVAGNRYKLSAKLAAMAAKAGGAPQALVLGCDGGLPQERRDPGQRHRRRARCGKPAYTRIEPARCRRRQPRAGNQQRASGDEDRHRRPRTRSSAHDGPGRA